MKLIQMWFVCGLIAIMLAINMGQRISGSDALSFVLLGPIILTKASFVWLDKQNTCIANCGR